MYGSLLMRYILQNLQAFSKLQLQMWVKNLLVGVEILY